MNNILGKRSDLYDEKNRNSKISANIKFTSQCKNGNIYHTIMFPNTRNAHELKNTIKNSLRFFLDRLNKDKKIHAFIVGLGNDSHTADSVGSRVLKHIKVNFHFEELGINISGNKVSSLEPGVLGETGIDTKRIIESVVDEIKPDVIIAIDSFVTENIDFLNKVIEITDKGVIPGSGIMGINTEISKNTIGIPVIVIGVVTAVEINIKNKNYLLSTNDIDQFVRIISEIIGTCLNEVLYHL